MTILLFSGVTQEQIDTETIKIHICAACGKRFAWSNESSWYGDIDEELCIKSCSPACRKNLERKEKK